MIGANPATPSATPAPKTRQGSRPCSLARRVAAAVWAAVEDEPMRDFVRFNLLVPLGATKPQDYGASPSRARRILIAATA